MPFVICVRIYLHNMPFFSVQETSDSSYLVVSCPLLIHPRLCFVFHNLQLYIIYLFVCMFVYLFIFTFPSSHPALRVL